jgi:adenylate kinase family enzyme
MPDRILVIGISGSGKSTLSRTLSARLRMPHIELDGLFWKPGWVAASDAEFRAAVTRATAAPRWIADGNYSGVRDVLWPRADTVIWLDYPLSVVWSQIWARSLQRLRDREELWNGNRESFRRTFCSFDSILWWVLTNHARRRRQLTALQAADCYPVIWHVIRTPDDIAGLLERLAPDDA